MPPGKEIGMIQVQSKMPDRIIDKVNAVLRKTDTAFECYNWPVSLDDNVWRH